MGGESYKIWGSALVALTVMLGIGVVVNEVTHMGHEEVMAYKVDVPEDGSAPAGAAPAEDTGPEPIAPLMAAADAGAGANVFKRCQTCHSVEQGGPNRVGPNLWNSLGGPKAGHDGFSYSAALTDMGGTWTYEDMNHFLANPRGFAPGTKMTFAGLRSAGDRADVIAYLREYTDNPPPLPEVEAAPEDQGETGEGQTAQPNGNGEAAPEAGENQPAQ